MGLGTLAQVLRPLHEIYDPADHPDLLVGLHGADDAAVYRVAPDLALIQTVDFFPPVVDDPYTYGAIAAANAMSDVYAMGGEVRLGLNITAWPEDLDPGMLAEILRGAAEKMREGGGVIAGGHTVFDDEPKYGLAVTGMIHPDAVLQKSGAQPGDVLLLTKAIGTGVLLTAAKQQREGGEAGYEAAVASMLQLNRHPSHMARAAGVHAMTDVTGYALLGHAAEVAVRSEVTIVIEAGSVPLLPDALAFAEAGAETGGGSRNRQQLGDRIRLPGDIDPALLDLLYDPQTSGPLLIAAPPGGAEALRAGIERATGVCAVIGHVEAGDPVVEVRCDAPGSSHRSSG